jgi:hypothetical protein
MNGFRLSQILGSIAGSHPRWVQKQHTSPLTTGNIFTFAGTIEISGAISAGVTTVIQAQATNIKLSVVNDALAAYDLGTNVDGNAAAVGTYCYHSGCRRFRVCILTANGVLNPTQASRDHHELHHFGRHQGDLRRSFHGRHPVLLLWRPISSDAVVAAA